MSELRSFSLLMAVGLSASVPLGFEATADAAALAAFWLSLFSLLRSQLGSTGQRCPGSTGQRGLLGWDQLVARHEHMRAAA